MPSIPGLRLVSISQAQAAFTNSVLVLDTLSPTGSRLRLVIKRMTDAPDPERATADFHGLRIARKHGIPAPEPVYLDATGELLGTPGIVSTFVEGTQVANPTDPTAWAIDLAELLLRIHDIKPSAEDRCYIYDGNDLGLYFLSRPLAKENGRAPSFRWGIRQQCVSCAEGFDLRLQRSSIWTIGPVTYCGTTGRFPRYSIGMPRHMATLL